MAANRAKTIEYALPMLSTAATYQSEGTSYLVSSDTTIYIPETTSRAFLSVVAEVRMHDNFPTVTTNLSGWGVRVSCDAGSNWTSVTSANGYNQSGENMDHVFLADVTAEFSARFSGASDTARWGFYADYSSTGQTLANASCKLIITYEYDDTAHTTTQIKTVRIPIESYNGRLSDSAQIIRQGSITGQLPALTSVSTPFLPEASVVIRQAFCELDTNFLPSTTTDTNFIIKVDSGGGETTYGLNEAGNSSSVHCRYLYDVTSVDWTSSHDLYARHTVASQSYYAHVGGSLIVTYEYNPSTTTTVLNSIVLTPDFGIARCGATTDDMVISTTKFYIEEPTTITLVQSGIFFTFLTNETSDTFSVLAGSQTATGYTPTSMADICGMMSFMHRIDSGGYRGAGVTLARGENTLTIKCYNAVFPRIGAICARCYLNYTSSVASGGVNTHNTTTAWLTFPSNRASASSVDLSNTVVPKIIESNYFISDIGEVLYYAGFTGGGAVSLQVQYAGTDSVTSGIQGIGSKLYVAQASSERLNNLFFFNATHAFNRYPNDPQTTRANIETSRYWWVSATGAQMGLMTYVTYHSITFTISGTISNYADADGAGLTVKFYKTSDGEYIGTTTTTSGGAYTYTWYDSAGSVFAECYEDSTHAGRSIDSTAS